jgi:hypothetical protein
LIGHVQWLDLVGLGDPLEARRKIRGLAHDAALLRLPGTNQVQDLE